jgi:pimeloyl-ACP methyl ester carboxylesterase
LDEPYWTNGGWKRGHLSSSSGPTPRVSSYEAIDQILGIVTDRTRFPAVDDVVVTGHSAGGQVAHRFAATSRVEDGVAGIHFRYVVANPSTFLYLGPERDGPNGFSAPTRSECSDYNEWHYGLEDLNSYASAVTIDSIRAQLVRRDVRILLGDADSLTASLDVSCGANLQGRYRFERGQTLVRFIDALYPGNGHQEMIVPGIGHSSSGMYLSVVGREALFGN